MNLLQRMKEIKRTITVKVKHGSNIYKTENSKTNTPDKFVLNLLQRLVLEN